MVGARLPARSSSAACVGRSSDESPPARAGSDLRRRLAEIDAEATRGLKTFLAAQARRSDRPARVEHAAVNRGSVVGLDTSPSKGVDACGMRDVAPILDLRTPFGLALSELDDRSGQQVADLSRLVDAARTAALAEDGAVFNGFGPARIDGIASSSPHDPIPLDADYEEFPVRSPVRSPSSATPGSTARTASPSGPAATRPSSRPRKRVATPCSSNSVITGGPRVGAGGQRFGGHESARR